MRKYGVGDKSYIANVEDENSSMKEAMKETNRTRVTTNAVHCQLRPTFRRFPDDPIYHSCNVASQLSMKLILSSESER